MRSAAVSIPIALPIISHTPSLRIHSPHGQDVRQGGPNGAALRLSHPAREIEAFDYERAPDVHGTRTILLLPDAPLPPIYASDRGTARGARQWHGLGGRRRRLHRRHCGAFLMSGFWLSEGCRWRWPDSTHWSLVSHPFTYTYRSSSAPPPFWRSAWASFGAAMAPTRSAPSFASTRSGDGSTM